MKNFYIVFEERNMPKVREMFKFFRNSYDISEWNRSDEKLLKAVESCDIDKVVSILDKKQVSPTKNGPRGYGALHYVCVKGYENLVDLFILRQTDVNAVNERGNSPLHLAAHNGHHNIVAKLLMAGASVNLQNPYQMTALHVACNSSHETVVHILIENQADVNAQDKTHKTPIFFACYHGHLGICKYLFEKGAALNITDISKVSPVLTAVRQSHVDITKFLLEKGADPYIEDNFEISAVKAGRESNTREIRKIFSKISKSSIYSDIELKREVSEDLSIQVMKNLSMDEHLNSESSDGVQTNEVLYRKDLVNTERRPISAPPPPPSPGKIPFVKSNSENIEDWVLPTDQQVSSKVPEKPELVDSFHSISENIEHESTNSLSVFPSDVADGNAASFLGLSVKEHQNRLSATGMTDIRNKWDQHFEEDEVSITSQVSEEPKLTVYDQDFSFISGNATPKMGRNISLRRQILALRQENNQLRETIQENNMKMKSQDDEIHKLEDLLSEKEESLHFRQEDAEELISDEDIPEPATEDTDDFEKENVDELLTKLTGNKQYIKKLPSQDNWQDVQDKNVDNLLQENLYPMENQEHFTNKINVVSSEIIPEEDMNLKDEVVIVQELKNLKEQHALLQSNYNELLSERDILQEQYEILQEERNRLDLTQQRLKQENDKATKQNCNLLNMKDNLKQDLEEMTQQKNDLQEEYDLLCKKTELLEKTVEKLSSGLDDEKLTVLQLDNSLLEDQCRKLLVEKDILEEANAEMKEEHNAIVKMLDFEKQELQAEKVKLAEKLEEMNMTTLTMQKEHSMLQQEIHFLKSQNEDRQSSIPDVDNSNLNSDVNSKIQLLKDEISRLQHQSIEAEKKFGEIVENYRLHLISAIQGFIDPDVEKALYSIIELRRLEFCC